MCPKNLSRFDERLERLNCRYNRPDRIAEAVDFEYFRSHLVEDLGYGDSFSHLLSWLEASR